MMQITVTTDDLPTAVSYGSVLTVTGMVSGSRGQRRATFGGDHRMMAGFLAAVADEGEAVAEVEPWQILGES